LAVAARIPIEQARFNPKEGIKRRTLTILFLKRTSTPETKKGVQGGDLRGGSEPGRGTESIDLCLSLRRKRQQKDQQTAGNLISLLMGKRGVGDEEEKRG